MGYEAMRITDSRYDRDRLRLTIAYRLISFEARTRTIRLATQLSDDRIRKLYRDYFLGRGGVPSSAGVESRHGRCRSSGARWSTSTKPGVLGALLRICDLLEREAAPQRPSLEIVARFCDVYETYAGLCQQPRITFEHAWHLWQMLSRADEFVLSVCQDCQSWWLRDTLDILPDNCAACRRGLFAI
jgi:hypothetical protein